MKAIAAFLSILSIATAFTAPSSFSPATRSNSLSNPQSVHHTASLKMAPGQRRKRKDGKQFAPPPSDAPSEAATAVETAAEVMIAPATAAEVMIAPAAPTPKQNTVVMQVRDIRDVLSGKDEAPSADEDDDDEELGEDEEWEYYDDDEEEDTEQSSSAPAGRTRDESMERLLADARELRSASSESATEPAESESSLSDTVFNVISTIVTVDFFVVMALLVWFLAGIFCSSVLKDDAVQIAFNMNFERVTQPALGILMIGSVAGALGKKDEQED